MKKKDLEKELSKHGWKFCNHGGNHDIWTNGVMKQAVPKHREINKFTAKGILKTAKANPSKED